MKCHLILFLTLPSTLAFSPSFASRNDGSFLNAKRGRGLDVPPSSAPSKKSNWIATSIPSLGDLPKETNVVKVIDTNVASITDKNINPTGAVSIVNYQDESATTTYCFSVSCASCKIPLTKGKVLPPKESGDARLQCDLCGATYNLRSGEQNKEEKLPVYALGEKGGKVFISMP
eukprot:scaffold19546_cov65-Cyclotella_meneghiniana.AAC.6